MHVEDIASQSSVVFETRYTTWLKEISYERWDNKSPFDSILCQQHLCQNLPKSVDVRWSYSVQHQCRFLRHSVDGLSVCMLSGSSGTAAGLWVVYTHCGQSWPTELYRSELHCDVDHLSLSPPIPLRLYTLPYWSITHYFSRMRNSLTWHCWTRRLVPADIEFCAFKHTKTHQVSTMVRWGEICTGPSWPRNSTPWVPEVYVSVSPHQLLLEN